MQKKSNHTLTLAFVAVIVLVALDQLTKYLALTFLAAGGPVVLLRGVFELRYLENRSAAFGFDLISFLQEKLQIPYFTEHPDAFLTFKMGVFAVLTAAVCVLLILVFLRIPEHNKRFFPMDMILIAFFSGAVGNCIDRVCRGYVVDFFYFCLIDFPIFNVADIYVTLSAFFMLVLGLFYYKESDFEALFLPKGKDS